MAAKKDKGGMESLRTDVQALAEAFWNFRDAMLTDVAAQQAEQQRVGAVSPGGWLAPDEALVQSSAALMNALAQPQRLRMAMMLAEGPTSVASLVEGLGLKTSGAAYHHLNVLINNGIAVQQERGTFSIAPEAVGQVTSLLVALFGSADASAEGGKKKKK